jgi:hypothetical protein
MSVNRAAGDRSGVTAIHFRNQTAIRFGLHEAPQRLERRIRHEAPRTVWLFHPPGKRIQSPSRYWKRVTRSGLSGIWQGSPILKSGDSPLPPGRASPYGFMHEEHSPRNRGRARGGTHARRPHGSTPSSGPSSLPRAPSAESSCCPATGRSPDADPASSEELRHSGMFQALQFVVWCRFARVTCESSISMLPGRPLSMWA